MSVASWSGSLLAWERELTALKDRVGLCVRRRELRMSIGHYLDGLLSGVERKTGWLLAERAGEARPHRLQAVLGRGRWDADAARDLVRTYAAEALADPDAVLVVDETVKQR
jgi:SRSO17 transposase